MKKTMLLLFALMLSSAICAQDYHVVLWDNTTAPTSNGLSGDEVESKPGQWKNTQTAEMWIYKAGDNATGQALVFFPGGGYSSLSVGNGHKEAQWFARNGITAAVVKYRLPNGHSEVPRNDADEALRVMRSMAAELNIDPAKVGVSGTSAGGYLAGSVGTLSDVKPGFMILFYPVISADPDKRHKGTFVQLLGAEDADKPLAQEFSLEKKVDAATPPTLLFHCDDDKVVPAVNSALFYQKLKEHGIKPGVASVVATLTPGMRPFRASPTELTGIPSRRCPSNLLMAAVTVLRDCVPYPTTTTSSSTASYSSSTTSMADLVPMRSSRSA